MFADGGEVVAAFRSQSLLLSAHALAVSRDD
jgi:hypothetical protein